MLEEIGLFKSVGVAGVVLGVLDLDGTVDVPRTRMWVFDLACYYMSLYVITGWWKLRSLCKVRWNSRRTAQTRIKRSTAVCFHRAFDMTRSAVEGMSIVVCHGRSRVDGSLAPTILY